MKQPHFMVHAAVTIMGEKHLIDIVTDLRANGPVYDRRTPDKEVCQFAFECPSSQMKESHFNQAFSELHKHCLERARAAGLIKA